MKNLIIIVVIIILYSCTKNPIGLHERSDLEILQSHHWKLQHVYRISYLGTNKDTMDYQTTLSQCEKDIEYFVGEPNNFLENGHSWMGNYTCAADSVYLDNIFSFDTINDNKYIKWGWFTISFNLLTLDDNTFSFYQTSIVNAADSIRQMYVFHSVQ